jgi:apolipoprotein N-acyltransferase
MNFRAGSRKTGKTNSFILSGVVATVLSGLLLTISFPDFDLWWLAWIALVPFFIAVFQERLSKFRTFLLGWIFGTVFIYGTCWWLTYAPIHYAGLPATLAYFIMFFVAAGIGIFFALFSLALGLLYGRYGARAVLAAPVLWVGMEFLRYLLTGNVWNALGYSQAFQPVLIQPAKYGSFFLVGFFIVAFNAALVFLLLERKRRSLTVFAAVMIMVTGLLLLSQPAKKIEANSLVASGLEEKPAALIIAVQPNVPMSGLNETEWQKLREKQAEMGEQALGRAPQQANLPRIIILPESPMNYMYERDSEFREFLHGYTRKTNSAVLFNSAEPSRETEQYYNSAVMVNERGAKVAQYNKIHLMPFGEYVPMSGVLSRFIPPMVGSFAFGTETNLLPFGEAKGGIMICFESHFPSLSRQFVLNGADVLVEMTNDGYLGPTPVLKQHLASAIYRAVETNRPLLRVTNVGISGYIQPDGKMIDATGSYVADTRFWTVAKSDGSQTFYVKYGDWFAILCTILSVALVVLNFGRFKKANNELH